MMSGVAKGCHPHRLLPTTTTRISEGCLPMTKRSTAADFVTAFATGWPENQPEIMVLSLTTHKGVQDFAFSKEQALLVAKTMNDTAARLAQPKARS
jgi:hypothetical protein